MATLHSLVGSFHLSFISSRDGLSGGLLLSSVGETKKVVRFVYNKALSTPSMIVRPSTILSWPHTSLVGLFYLSLISSRDSLSGGLLLSSVGVVGLPLVVE